MIFKRIFLFLIRRLVLLVLSFLVFSSASAWIVLGTIGSESAVKNWLAESETYERLPNTLFELIEQDASNNPDGGAVVTDAIENGIVDIDAVKIATADDYTAEFLQGESETAIAAIFAWLQGDTDRPEFSISLEERSQSFISNLESELTEQLEALPNCGSIPSASSNFNLLSATCLPAGIDVQTEVARFSVELADFTTPLAENERPLTAEYTGEDLYESLGADGIRAADAYQAATIARIAFPALALIVAVIVVLIARTKGDGLRAAGSTFTSSGISLGVGALFLSFSASFRTAFYESQPDESFRIIANGFLESFLQVVITDVVNQMIIVTVVMIVVGVVLWLLGIRLTPPEVQRTIDAQSPGVRAPEIAVESLQPRVQSQTVADAAAPVVVPAVNSVPESTIVEPQVAPPVASAPVSAPVQSAQKVESSNDTPVAS